MTRLSPEAAQGAIASEFAPLIYRYDERDVALYALGIGAGRDPLNARDLRFVYEGSGDFAVLPGFALLFTSAMNRLLLKGEIGGLRFDPAFMVHGEQFLQLHGPLPPRATVTSTWRIRDIFDKGSGLLLIVESESEDEAGIALATARSSVFLRGYGGFGGERGTSETVAMPERAPDIAHEQKTEANQALLYRLCGDPNPLHADPTVAARAGFERPILHGLCTLGFALRAILERCCEHEPSRLSQIGVRFAQPVYPGETLRHEIWRLPDGELRFRSVAKEREVVALSNGQARIAG